MNLPSTAISLALLLASAAPGQTVREEAITPVSTDPQITIALASHRVAFDPAIPHRNQLLVYLHGAGGTATTGTDLLQTGAELGFHAVGITYYMDQLPSNFCGANAACYESFRREILEGADLNPNIAISRANSVENRIVKLLQHLNTLHPGEGWSQFIEAGNPRWSQIQLYGHSMGGSNVCLLAKLHSVVGVCVSAPATDVPMWWTNPQTPAAKIFGFSHVQDRFTQIQNMWTAMGLNQFGPVQDVASATTPFGGTHMLSTSVEPARAGEYHNSPTTDPTTPRTPDGTPVYKPVWAYMLLGGQLPCNADYNDDGGADNSDVTALANDIAAGTQSYPPRTADFNGDGGADNSDVTDLANAVAGGPCP